MAEFLDTVKRAAAAENRAEQVTAITPGLQQGRGDAIACRRRFPRHRARARAERAQLPQGDGGIAGGEPEVGATASGHRRPPVSLPSHNSQAEPTQAGRPYPPNRLLAPKAAKDAGP